MRRRGTPVLGKNTFKGSESHDTTRQWKMKVTVLQGEHHGIEWPPNSAMDLSASIPKIKMAVPYLVPTRERQRR